LHYFFFLLALTGCSYFNGDRKETAEPSEYPRIQELREMRDEKAFRLAALLDHDGYPVPRNDCDLTLWVGEACYAGVKVNLDLVELEPGLVHRRPTPCWSPEGGDLGSKSTGSNDMQAGYMACRVRESNLAAFQRLAARGEANTVYLPIPGWVMGQPYPEMATRVVMRPNGIGLVGRAIYLLSGGADDRSYRKWQPLYGGGADYERHIQALSILTDGVVMERLRKQGMDAAVDQPQPAPADLVDLTMQELEALQHYAETEPFNYFYQAILFRYTGNPAPAVDLLLDPATPVPSYVRGTPQEAFELIHWLIAAKVVLERFGDGE
jgi:hypothetical protein